MGRTRLQEVEGRSLSCIHFRFCSVSSHGKLALSRITPLHPGRGSTNPRLLIVTASPDATSALGNPYTGGSGTRMLDLFRVRDYGIAPDKSLEAADDLEIMRRYRIYRTSGVKCGIQGQEPPSELTVRQCTRYILADQIALFPELALIIPMGVLAVASILGLRTLDRPLASFVGRRFLYHRNTGGAPIWVVPTYHPSPANPSFMSAGASPTSLDGVRATSGMQRALGFVGEKCRAIGLPTA